MEEFVPKVIKKSIMNYTNPLLFEDWIKKTGIDEKSDRLKKYSFICCDTQYFEKVVSKNKTYRPTEIENSFRNQTEDLFEHQYVKRIINAVNNKQHFYICPEIVNAVESYDENVSNVSQIPLYFVAYDVGHSFFILVLNEKIYTIGIGVRLEGAITSDWWPTLEEGITLENKGDVNIMSPDPLFKTPKIVDIGIFNTTHLEKLNEYVRQLNTMQIFLKKNGDLIGYFAGIPARMSFWTNNHYSKEYLNCVTFVTTIFPNINCQEGITNSTVSKYIPNQPNMCFATPILTVQKYENIISAYNENNVIKLRRLLDPYCINDSCSISGGIKNKKKSKINKRTVIKNKKNGKKRTIKNKKM